MVDDLPGGGPRLEQRAVGFKATVVNGRVTIEDGEHTGEYAGALVRNPLARRRAMAAERGRGSVPSSNTEGTSRLVWWPTERSVRPSPSAS